MTMRLSFAAVCVVLALAAGTMRFGFSVVEAAQEGATAQGTTQPPPGMAMHGRMGRMHQEMMMGAKGGMMRR
jgi:hypothetical protein